jgi:hypothetical protein
MNSISRQQNINNPITRTLGSVPDERLYFAGLKNTASSNKNTLDNNKNSLMNTVTDLIMDNPLESLAVGIVAGMGLYYGGKPKKSVVISSSSKTYTDALKSMMTGTACLIASSGIIKYMTQEPLEVEKLRRDITQLQKKNKIAKQKSKQIKSLKSVPIVTNTPKATNYYDAEIAKLFNT